MIATSGCEGVSLRLHGRQADYLSEGFPGSGLPASFSLLSSLSRALGHRLPVAAATAGRRDDRK